MSAVAAHRRALPTGGAALLAGFAVDAALGDPARLHPVAGFGGIAGALERRFWHPSRIAGVIYASLLVGLAATAGGSLGALRSGQLRGLAAAACLWAALGGRSLAAEGLALSAQVRDGDLQGARSRARTLVGRETEHLDQAELCRAAIESIAENTADAVIGPCLWTALAGSAGAAGYRAANTLDAMVGHRSPRYERFGWASARLDDALTWPAARLGALLAVALAPLVGGSSRRAERTLRRDGGAHPSPNAGRLEAAFAGALGVGLGGVNRYDGRVEARPPLGDGPVPGPDDVERAVVLSAATGAAAALLCAGLAAILANRGRA